MLNIVLMSFVPNIDGKSLALVFVQLPPNTRTTFLPLKRADSLMVHVLLGNVVQSKDRTEAYV